MVCVYGVCGVGERVNGGLCDPSTLDQGSLTMLMVVVGEGE
jgi:hypothetical protein